MIVLGIDPGSRRTGWGVVRQEGSRLRLLEVGVVRPEAKAPLAERLSILHGAMGRLLDEFHPDVVGMETVFHGPNTKSLVILGQARGALMAGLATAPLVELTPAEVKKAVTGRGGATKEQVSHMVGALLGSEALATAESLGAQARLDATDALAVAVATVHRSACARISPAENAGAKSSSRGLSGKGGGGFYARNSRNLG